MKKFRVYFYKSHKLICSTVVLANDEEEAELYAEFRIMCKLSNVHYDAVKATAV